MEKIKTIVATFVACDGKVFNSEEACLEYETKLQEEKAKEFVKKQMFDKMNFVNMRGNDYLFEKYVDGFGHHYLAYKFVYNSEFSLEEYVKILGCDFVRNFPFETIINGELKYDVSLKDMPSLEAGETYLIISFTDLSGDYTNPTYWYLYKLDDFKKFQIKEINEL